MRKHQQKITPLIELPFDTIDDFPVGDSLHLIDYGITKRMIFGWRDGTLGNIDAKWSSSASQTVSNFINSLTAPAEIRAQRAIRGFEELSKWKALHL